MPLSYSALRPVPVNQTQEHLHGSSAVSGWDTARLRAHFRHPALPAAPQRPLRLTTTFALSATRTLEPSPKRAKIPSALTCPSPVTLSPRVSPPARPALPEASRPRDRPRTRSTSRGESPPQPRGRLPSPAQETVRSLPLPPPKRYHGPPRRRRAVPLLLNTPHGSEPLRPAGTMPLAATATEHTHGILNNRQSFYLASPALQRLPSRRGKLYGRTNPPPPAPHTLVLYFLQSRPPWRNFHRLV